MAFRTSGGDSPLLAEPTVRSRFLHQSQNRQPVKDASGDLLSQVRRVVLECEVGTKMEKFELCGGAESNAFVTVASVDHTLMPYMNTWLKNPPPEKPKPKTGIWQRLLDYVKPPVTECEKSEKPARREGQFAPGDMLLTVGAYCVAGFREAECLQFLRALVFQRNGSLTIEILPGEALETTSLQYIVQLGKHAGPQSLEYKLRRNIRINYERDIVPLTTRPRRPDDAKIHGDYHFECEHFFLLCIQEQIMIDYGEINGYYYGYGPFNLGIDRLTGKKLNEYLNCKIRSRNNSFNDALGFHLTEAERDRSKAKAAYLANN